MHCLLLVDLLHYLVARPPTSPVTPSPILLGLPLVLAATSRVPSPLWRSTLLMQTAYLLPESRNVL